MVFRHQESPPGRIRLQGEQLRCVGGAPLLRVAAVGEMETVMANRNRTMSEERRCARGHPIQPSGSGATDLGSVQYRELVPE